MNAPRHGLRMNASLYDELMRELAKRGGGVRESGAFLLGSRLPDDAGPPFDVVSIAYYDDLDPSSLTGGITFRAAGYSQLSALCRETHTKVVGDVHTHPSRHVAQSHTDATHPMVGIAGHVAFIAPEFAADAPRPHQLGAHLRQQDGSWTSLYGPGVATVLDVTAPLHRSRGIAHARAAVARIAPAIRHRIRQRLTRRRAASS